MLKIKKLTLGQLQTNCYIANDGEEALIIDPGDDADYIMRVISDEEVKPKMIIATHGHYDHILAVTELKLAYNIPFLMHKDDEFLLKNMKSSAQHFSGIKADPAPKVDKYLKENDNLVVGSNLLQVIETSGHTPGSLSLYNKDENILFAGDLIFAGGGVGRTDFVYSDKIKLLNSIKKLSGLPKKTIVYSGHGEESKIADVIK